MVDIGPVEGLGNVRQLPDAGWTTNSLACEQGHGFIIQVGMKSSSRGVFGYPDYHYFDGTEDDYWEGTQYIRLYIVEPIVNTLGEIMGAKIKYQYPFIPE